MTKIICALIILVAMPIFANDTVDALIEINEMKVEYDSEAPKEKFLKSINQTFDVTPGQEGTIMHATALDTKRKITELVEIHMSWPVIRNSIKQAYLTTYTQEELNYMLEISKTSIGKSLIQKSNLLAKNIELFSQENIEEFQKEYKKITDIYFEASSAHIEELRSNLPTE